jgi:hypothetical protein
MLHGSDRTGEWISVRIKIKAYKYHLRPISDDAHYDINMFTTKELRFVYRANDLFPTSGSSI